MVDSLTKNTDKSLIGLLKEKSRYNIGDKVCWTTKEGNTHIGEVIRYVVGGSPRPDSNGDFDETNLLLEVRFDVNEDSSFTVTDEESSFEPAPEGGDFDFENTYIAFVLDESGSMETIKKEIIEGFNEQVQAIKEGSKNSKSVKVSLTTFSGRAREVFFNKSLSRLKPLTEDDYQPSSLTAMLDGVGTTVDRLKEETDYQSDDNKYLIIILSDGKENNSSDYTYQKVGETIQELEKNHNFTFTYLGANQDLTDIEESLNISPGNTLRYKATKSGTEEVTVTLANATQANLASGDGQSDNFYGG